jgi:hypothetical protein
MASDECLHLVQIAGVRREAGSVMTISSREPPASARRAERRSKVS